MAIGYTLLGKIVLSGNHSTYGLTILLNVFLFVVVLEAEKIVIVYMRSYQIFMRSATITIFFVLIYLPFIVIFMSGYFYTGLSSTYLYYFSIAGFFYIWLVITLVGVFIHWLLNLT